jgi:hyperosmotically inducible periplasmic protein
MNTQTRNRLTRLSAVAMTVGAMAFAGCSQRDQDDAKAKADQAVTDVKQKSSELAADVKQAGSEMKADIKEAAADAKDKTSAMRNDAASSMDKAKASVVDATITASVKAELAKDAVLKAREINVDTEKGRVSLRGTAPTAEARDRAKVLAESVHGVVSVNNELMVANS